MWATIHYVDATTMAVEFPFEAARKAAIGAMSGATWDKTSSRWKLPVQRLGDTVKLFWPNVTIDYEVLRARDEQIKRLIRQYMACGVRFNIVGGKVRCDHELLDNWLQKHGTSLHVQAHEEVSSETRNEN